MPLRVLLTSDLHLGMKFAGYPEDVRAALVEARFTCLDRVVAGANAAESDLLVIAGDLFESVGAAQRDILRAAKSLGAFRGKLVAVLPGNHDYLSGEDKLWTKFRDHAGDGVLLLDAARPWPLTGYDLDACLYPGPCTDKHSPANAIGWVRAAEKDRGIRHHIGVAHGSLEGLSLDREGLYYPMKLAELAETGVKTWLIGHTHLPFPTEPGPRDLAFIAGTPEPDGFDCTHGGSAWSLDLADDGAISAAPVPTGELRFRDEARTVHSAADLDRLERELTAGAPKRTLLRLRLSGRAPRPVLDDIEGVRARLRAALLHLDFRTDQLREEITADAIDREYPAGSFPHSLLSALAAEDDQEALQIAHDFLQELGR
ncbi:MAG TPA: metallophosphoesterase [Spirochaetia bacterium]|nr:metallophosphoesterase [Spirochaetia bacterium]